MNLKNNKGITLVALAITIIVIIILASITIYSATGVIKEAKLQNVTTDLLMLEAKVKGIAEEYRFDEINNQLIGTKLSEITDTNITELATKAGVTNSNEWYYITPDDLNTMRLGALEGEYYLVKYIDTSTGEVSVDVINADGYKHSDGNTYYKLSDLEKLVEE